MDMDLSDTEVSGLAPFVWSCAEEPRERSPLLVCEECGRIDVLRDSRLGHALRRLLRRVPLASPEYELRVFGLCERCSR